MQNIPRASEYRAAFVAPDGYKIIAADYAGCELREIAELSQEAGWMEALEKGYDLHSYVASVIFEIEYKELTENNVIKKKYKELRQQAKSINFGVAYGMGAHRLAKELDIEQRKAQKLLNQFWEKFPAIKELLDKLVKDAEKNGYAYSPLDGRRRYLTHTDWGVPSEKAHASNEAKNLPFQGGNATITKIALYRVKSKLEENDFDAKIINVVHDEILVEVHASQVDEVCALIENEMVQAAYELIKTVPMVAESNVGDCWIH